MKKITLILCMLVFSAFAFSQNCLRVLSTSHFAPELDANGHITSWQLIINYETDGNKGLQTTIICGRDTILSDCFDIHADSTKIYSGLVCAGGLESLMAILQPKTGSCKAAECDSIHIGGPSGGPLPVLLSVFFAKRNNNNSVLINWKTATEINAKAFIVERKTNAGFVSIASIPATGDATGGSYSYVDINANSGTSQYRLRIVEQNGTFSYSNISAIKGTAMASGFTLFPNPSNGYTKVTVSDISSPTYIQVVDISGRMIKNVLLNNGGTVELNNLEKGVYMIRMINKTSGESIAKKLSVVN